MDIPRTQPELPEGFDVPDKTSSLKKVQDLLIQYNIWVLGNEFAKAQKIDYEKFINNLTYAERQALIEKATIEAFDHSGKLSDLVERVGMSLAYKIMRRSMYRTHGEFDTFEQFLVAKMETGSKTQAYDAAFLLQMLESFEANEKGFKVDGMLSDKLTYRTFVASIPRLREKKIRLDKTKEHTENVVKSIKNKIKEVRKEMLEETDEKAISEMHDQIVSMNQEIDEVQGDGLEEQDKALADLSANLSSAIELANTHVSREEVSKLLPKMAKEKLKKDGWNPAEISDEYNGGHDDEEDNKPLAYRVNLNGVSVFVLGVKDAFGNQVERMMSTMFDVHRSELSECIDLLKSYRKEK